MAAQEDPHTYVDFVRPIIAAYSNVVIHGRKRALHALPRLLTALVEFGADSVKVDAALAGKGASGAAAAMLERLKQAAEQHLGEVRLCQRWPACVCWRYPGLYCWVFVVSMY